MTRTAADSDPNEAIRSAESDSARDATTIFIERACPLCGADEHAIHLEAGDTTFGFPGLFKIARCTTCEMLYTRPQVAPESIGAYFPEDYSAHDADRARRHSTTKKGRDPWDTLEPAGDRNLLDVGCGSGAFMLRQRDRGWNVFGIEPSESAAEVARSLGLENVWTGDVASAPIQSRQFDVITLMGVLDHIPTPLAALTKLYDVCGPGGRLIATVPNAGGAAAGKFGPHWPGWDLPRHQNHFTPKTLADMLRKAGFDRVEVLWKRRTSHWRQGARLYADATGNIWWRSIAASRNLCGLVARLRARGPQCDELIAVAHRQ